MADSLAVLFQLKAQNQASPVVHQVQSDVTKLTKSASTDFNALQSVATSALGKVTSSLTNFSGQLPIVGNAVSGLTSELTSMGESTAVAGGQFAAIAGPIGIAVAGIAAMAVGVVKLSESLFAISRTAGEAQGKLFDLSQQTGVSVETLAALDLLAKTTGGNIEALAASLGIFQKNLEDAQDPASKVGATFNRLGIEVTNTEDALRQTLATLARMPEGFAQTALALELFGRGGKQFLAILKEAHGDIDQTIRELQEMGLASTANAKRADEFNDQLIRLQTQLTAITVTLGNEVIPIVQRTADILSKTLKENKDAVDALSAAVKVLAFAIGTPLQGAIGAIGLVWRTHRPEIQLIVELYERLAAAVQAVAGKVPKITGNEIPAQATGSLLGGPNVGIDLGILSEGLVGGGEKAVATKKALNNEREKERKLQQEINEINRRTLSIQREIEAEENKKARAMEAAGQSLSRFIEAQNRAIKGTQSASEETRIFILQFEALNGAMNDNDKFWIRFNAAIIDSIRNLKELKETFDDVVPNINLGDRGVPAPGNVPIDIGEPPENISVWEKAMGALRDQMESFSDFLDNTFIDSLFGVADALAQGVAAWALYGGSFAQAMRQSLAALAAKIAAEATLQAALHAAYAIASLAFGDFGSAAQHAIAAAKFGAIAAGAAIGARAIAGGAFSSQSSGSGASSSGSGGKAKTQQSSQPTPIEIPRTVANNQAIVQVLEFRVKGDAVVDEFVRDYDLNGRTRIKIISDGQG